MAYLYSLSAGTIQYLRQFNIYSGVGPLTTCINLFIFLVSLQFSYWKVSRLSLSRRCHQLVNIFLNYAAGWSRNTHTHIHTRLLSCLVSPF